MSTERSNEIVSTTRIKVRPENYKELCLTLASLLDLIRQEEGCWSYRFYGEAEDQNAFVLIGEWETREAWNHHLQSDNFAVLLGSLKLLGNRAEVEFKLLSHITGVEAVTRARCHPHGGAPSTICLS